MYIEAAMMSLRYRLLETALRQGLRVHHRINTNNPLKKGTHYFTTLGHYSREDKIIAHRTIRISGGGGAVEV